VSTWWLLVALPGALLVAGCVTYVVVTYTHLALVSPPPPPPARLLRAAFVELATTIALLPLWPLWWLVGATYEVVTEGDRPPGGSRRPIILLHGLAMNRTNWVWLGRRLARLGFGPLYGTSYFSPQSVERSAAHLARFVERVLARERAAGRRCESVDIVAHSLGGLVARYYIERMDGAARVGRLVTIATPHNGTLLARIGLVPAARALRPHRPSKNGTIVTPAGTARYASIWSRADSMIVPPESASIAPSGADRAFDDLGHLSLLLSPRVLDAVVEQLSSSSVS
jgi:triacylglycerol esterase/lipase EstA (alpha/beta hydrolase family)